MTAPVSPTSSAAPAGRRFGSGSVFRFVLAAIPWVAVLVGTPFANAVQPYVLGMPFLLVWVVLCVIATSVCMAIVYLTDPRNRTDDPVSAADESEAGR